MNILIIGGFLGSGKTTIIKSLISGLIEAQQTCAIIENEIGEVGIDDSLLEEANIEITSLFGGCVCCQISGNLVTASQKIQDEINPDWIIVEMTGLALIESIRKVFVDYGRPDVTVHTVSVVDMQRWEHLMGPLAVIFNGQVAGADIILLNKTDKAKPTAATYEVLHEKAPTAQVLALDEATKEPNVLWELLVSRLAQRTDV